MNKYVIYETYEQVSIFRVEANSEEEAFDLVSDDAAEYRDYEAEDYYPQLIKKEIVKVKDEEV